MDKEKRKRIGLAALLVVLAGVMVWQFVLADNSTESAPAASAKPGQPGTKAPKTSTDQGEEGYRPLPLAALDRGRGASAAPSRNIFTFYVPPPKPYVPPPLPPAPLQITSISPSMIYAGIGDQVLQVTGNELPADSRIFVNGQALASTIIGGKEVTATLGKSLLASPAQLSIEIRDGGGTLFSNKLNLTISAPPPPPYKYVGRIDNLAFLSGGGNQPDERFPLLLGSVIDKRWKLTKIGDEQLTMEDTILHILHPIRIASDGNASNLSASPDVSQPLQQGRDARRQLLRQRGIEPGEDEDDTDHKDPDRPDGR